MQCFKSSKSDTRRLLMLVALLLVMPGILSAQFGSVRGQVAEKETGDPLPGANILIKGTTIGSSTGLDGRYRMTRVPAGQ